jgi:hypothetical protein
MVISLRLTAVGERYCEYHGQGGVNLWGRRVRGGALHDVDGTDVNN